MTCVRCGRPLDAGQCLYCSSTGTTPPGILPFDESANVAGPPTNEYFPDAGHIPPGGAGGWVDFSGQVRDEYHPYATRRPPRRTISRAFAQPESKAVFYAAAWSLPYLICILLVAYIVARIDRISAFDGAIIGDAHSAQPHTGSPYSWYAVPAIVCWTICTAVEVLLARQLAESYTPHGLWTWMRTPGVTQAARRRLSAFDRKLANDAGYVAPFAMAAGGLLLVICGTLAAAAPLTPWLSAVLALTAACMYIVRRRWTGDLQPRTKRSSSTQT